MYDDLLAEYREKFDREIFPLLISTGILLSISFLTINVQIQKVRKINPAETLRAD